MEKEIATRLEQAITEKVFPGAVVGIVRKDGVQQLVTSGHFTYAEDSHLVQQDTIFDVASLTKSVVTASLGLSLVERGELNFEDKLIEYLPEFNNSDRENVLIKHLFTYTIGGYGMGKLTVHDKSPEKLVEYVLTHDFEERPGTVFRYSNVPAFLLGLAIERITGETLAQLAEPYFKALDMTRTTFFPEHFAKDEIVPTEIDEWRGLVQGVVHDESAYVFKTMANRIVGHAGLFSTAPDILKFMHMLLNNGTIGNQSYFLPETVEQMQTNQIAHLHDYTGLGWELNQPRYMGPLCSPRTFGKTGFTGCLCVADIDRNVAFVILSNRIYPQRPSDSTAINAVRADVADIVFRSLEEDASFTSLPVSPILTGY